MVQKERGEGMDTAAYSSSLPSPGIMCITDSPIPKGISEGGGLLWGEWGKKKVVYIRK